MARVTLKSRFPEIIGNMPRRVSSDLKDAAENIERNASAKINSKTGMLDASGEVSGGAGEYKVEFGQGDAYYAQWIEFGRKNAPPFPFLLPAAEEEAPALLSKITETINTL